MKTQQEQIEFANKLQELTNKQGLRKVFIYSRTN